MSFSYLLACEPCNKGILSSWTRTTDQTTKRVRWTLTTGHVSQDLVLFPLFCVSLICVQTSDVYSITLANRFCSCRVPRSPPSRMHVDIVLSVRCWFLAAFALASMTSVHSSPRYLDAKSERSANDITNHRCTPHCHLSSL